MAGENVHRRSRGFRSPPAEDTHVRPAWIMFPGGRSENQPIGSPQTAADARSCDTISDGALAYDVAGRLLDLVPDATFNCFPNGTIRFCNVALLRLIGAGTSAEATRRGSGWIAGSGRGGSIWEQAAVIQGFLSADATVPRGDGTCKPIRVQIRALRADVLSKVWGFEGVVISPAEKTAHRQVARLRSRLVRRITRVTTARAEERKLLSRRLHDGLGQTLVVMKMELDRLARVAPPGDRSGIQVERRSVTALRTWSEDAIRMVRTLCAELREVKEGMLDVPSLLHTLVREFGRQWKLRTHIRSIGTARIEARRALMVGEICREALTNIARHAHATNVTVRLIARATHLTIAIADDGRGFSNDALARPDSFGVLGMRERAQALGGSLDVVRKSGKTTVTLSLPFTTFQTIDVPARSVE